MQKRAMISLIFLGSLMAGSLGGTLYKNPRQLWSPSSILELAARNDSLKQDNKQLASQIAELSQTRGQQDMASNYEKHRQSAGLTDLAGPGVEIELTAADNNGKPNPATFGLLGQHVVRLVNTLWNGGAEAISINGERYTSFTEVFGLNSYLQINSRKVYPPYVIEAIGDPTLLTGALKFTNGTK